MHHLRDFMVKVADNAIQNKERRTATRFMLDHSTGQYIPVIVTAQPELEPVPLIPFLKR